MSIRLLGLSDRLLTQSCVYRTIQLVYNYTSCQWCLMWIVDRWIILADTHIQHIVKICKNNKNVDFHEKFPHLFPEGKSFTASHLRTTELQSDSVSNVYHLFSRIIMFDTELLIRTRRVLCREYRFVLYMSLDSVIIPILCRKFNSIEQVFLDTINNILIKLCQNGFTDHRMGL